MESPLAQNQLQLKHQHQHHKRPLGIPTIKDRCLQSLVKLVLEPVTGITSDLNSFGFRKDRSAKNAGSEICS